MNSNQIKRYPRKIFEDNRGELCVVYEGIELSGQVTLKRSISHVNVFRGLHLQLPESSQKKIIEVLSGEILSLIINFDHRAEDYGRLKAQRISSTQGISLEISESYAHGFVALSEVHFQYLCIGNYFANAELCILPAKSVFEDNGLNFDNLIISEKDKKGISLESALKISENYNW